MSWILVDSIKLEELTKPPECTDYCRSEYTQLNSGIVLKVAITKGEAPERPRVEFIDYPTKPEHPIPSLPPPPKVDHCDIDQPTNIPEPSYFIILAGCFIGAMLIKRVK